MVKTSKHVKTTIDLRSLSRDKSGKKLEKCLSKKTLNHTSTEKLQGVYPLSNRITNMCGK